MLNANNTKIMDPRAQVAPLIDIPKGFSSKMTLEVAPRGLDIANVKV